MSKKFFNLSKIFILSLSISVILIGYSVGYANGFSNGNGANSAIIKGHEQFCEQMGGTYITNQSHAVLGPNTLDAVMCAFKNKDDIKYPSLMNFGLPLGNNGHIGPLSRAQLNDALSKAQKKTIDFNAQTESTSYVASHIQAESTGYITAVASSGYTVKYRTDFLAGAYVQYVDLPSGIMTVAEGIPADNCSYKNTANVGGTGGVQMWLACFAGVVGNVQTYAQGWFQNAYTYNNGTIGQYN